jgi:hypothetical protein
MRCPPLDRWTVAVLTGVVLAAGVAALPPDALGQSAPAGSPNLQRALKLIAAARESFADVQDYTLTLVKRETVNGQQLPENVIALKIRQEPFSVHMRWLKPKPLEGQEACYVAGKNNGMMRVKPPGLLGAMGFVNLDPKDNRARQMSRHNITEAGLGNLIERYAQRWESERGNTKTKFRIGESDFMGKKCVRVETAHPGSKPGDFYAFRSIVYFDKETHLPARCECFDWPKEGGKPEGEQTEVYNFTELKLNVGLTDDAFSY